MLIHIFTIVLACASVAKAAIPIQEHIAGLPAELAAVYNKVGQPQYLETSITLCDTQMVQFILESGSYEAYGSVQWKNVVFSLMKGSQDILRLVLSHPKTIETVDMSTSSNMILKGAIKKGYNDIVDLVFAHSAYDHAVHGQDHHVMQFFDMLDLDEQGQETFQTCKPIEWLLILAKNNDTIGLGHLLADKRWDPSIHAAVYSELTNLLTMNQNYEILKHLEMLNQGRANSS